jgi:hypothetical protein
MAHSSSNHSSHRSSFSLEHLESRELMSISSAVADLSINGIQVGQRSGVAVAAWGDNLVIGAYLTDVGSAADAGAVYIKSGATGDHLLTITKPAPATGDLFGQAVAASSDGYILVGAPLDNLTVADAGAVYLFSGVDGKLQQTFANPSPNAGDQFGSAVAFVGTQFVLIGAKGDDTMASNAGAAYLFDRFTGKLVASYYNPTASSGEYFGNAVAAIGDDVVIGCYYDDRGGYLRNGAVYVYSGAQTGFVNTPKLTITNPTPWMDDHFGISLAAHGSNILIGADGEDKGAIDAGAAYLYDGTTGSLLHTFHNPSPAISDKFGNSVALNSTHALIGAQADDHLILNSGSAYLFDLGTGLMAAEYHNPYAGLGDNFGASVALSDDGDVLIGAAGDDSGLLLDSGSVHLFRR